MKSLFSISYQLVGFFPYSEKFLSIFCSFLPDLIKHGCTLLMYIHVFLILLGGKVIFLLVNPILYFHFSCAHLVQSGQLLSLYSHLPVLFILVN